MKYEEQERLRKQWERTHPGKRCPHERTQREIVVGCDSGDRECLDCGAVLSPAQIADLASSKAQNPKDLGA